MKKRLQWASVVCDFGYSETNCPTISNHFRRWTIVIWDKFLHQVQRPSTNRKNSRTIPPLHKLGPWWRLCVQMTSWIEFELKDNPWLILVLFIVQLIWTSNTNLAIFLFVEFFSTRQTFSINIKTLQKMPIQIVNCNKNAWQLFRLMIFKFLFPKIGCSYELNVGCWPCSKNWGLNCHLFTFIAFKGYYIHYW